MKANRCLYVIRSLRKEGCSHLEVDRLFKSLVLPNFLYGLSVYGASDSDLSLIQTFFGRCFKRKINTLLPKQNSDMTIYKKVIADENYPIKSILS